LRGLYSGTLTVQIKLTQVGGDQTLLRGLHIEGSL